jgi:adenylate kinase family enzyme
MGHIFVLCGPPGVGKTTLLKLIQQHKLPFEQLQRMTTREPRTEEGDTGKSNLEYEFLSPEEFAGRLARGSIANFIEWSGNFYTTDIDMLTKALESDTDSILYEDMPSAISLKHHFGSRITIILLFTDDRDELLKLEFASLISSRRDSLLEWKRRLGQKYTNTIKQQGKNPNDSEKNEYIKKKMSRAIPDLAFMTGKLRALEDIYVLANRKDRLEETISDFKRIVMEVKNSQVSKENPSGIVFVLMPFRDEFNKIYRFVIKPAVEKEGLRCLRGDEIFAKLNVVDDILSNIEGSSLIISDISGGNPNVFLELGICMKLNKPIILITQDSEAPFDVRTCRWIKYENTLDGWEKLNSQISDAIRKVKRREDIAM